MDNNRPLVWDALLFLLFFLIVVFLYQIGWFKAPVSYRPSVSTKIVTGKDGGIVPVINGAGEVFTDRRAEVTNLEGVYDTHDHGDAGPDLVKSWSRVKPEEKKKIAEELDRRIADSSAAVAADPSDKKAKHMLFIAETLKNLTASGFNIDLSARSETEIKE